MPAASMLGRILFSATVAGFVFTQGPLAAAQTPAAPTETAAPAAPTTPPPAPAPDYSWQHRFELERPSVIRDVEGTPIPAGYEPRTRYDSRRVIVGSVSIGLGYAATIAASSILAPGDPNGFVPCAGPFIVDRPPRSEGDFVHVDALFADIVGVLGCSLQILGAIELTRAFIDDRPVLVRSGTASANSRFTLSARADGSKALLDAKLRF
ncbi:MAG TPA: hypothetical protein VGP93_08055 [Polyangiaceae bacterium]|nr:hypothetical protein [Polyangiaceae bacterium]